MRKITILIALVAAVAGLPRTYAAAYTTPGEERQQQEQAEREQTEKKLSSYVGKTFWIVPNPKAISRKAFFDELPRDYRAKLEGEVEGRGVFLPTETSKFVVTSYVLQDYDCFLQVQFEDGREGFLSVNRHDPSDFFYQGDTRFDFEEYIYAENPANIDKREAQRRAASRAAARAKAARGGVHVGMTKAEVLRSSWGRPRAINRTITSGHVSEQWVYGGNNYLYFDNGILTGIQN